MVENKQVLDIFRECGSLLEGHFLLSSGKHADRYCQCAKLLQYPELAEKVVEVVAERVKGFGATAVVGPAMGGIVVAYELARRLGVRGFFTERVDGVVTLRRGFEVAAGERVLIAEDVVTTGKSTLEVVDVLRKLGAEIVGLCCLVDRRALGVELPLPLYSATTLQAQTFEAQDCPLCRGGGKPEKPGSRETKSQSRD